MKRTSPQNMLHVIHLTNILEEDIRSRKLAKGESYFTTAEASKFLNVAGCYANQALQLLEKRRVIKRRQRSGAVIQGHGGEANAIVSNVHLLVQETYFRREGSGSGQILSGLQSELPLSHVGYDLLTPENERQLIDQIVTKTLANNDLDGFVMVSSSWYVQHVIAESGLPAVIHGTPYNSIRNVPYIERNHEEAHQKTLQWFRLRNRHRVAWLFRDLLHPGDFIALNTIRRSRFFRSDSPLLFTTSEHLEIMASVRDLLLGKNPPDAFVCHSLLHAEAVEEVLLELKLVPYRDIDIVVIAYFFDMGKRAKYTHIEINIPPEIIGRKIGTMLRNQVLHQKVESEILPVQLVPCLRSETEHIQKKDET